MNFMRREDRKMTDAEAQALLNRGEYGILATVDENGRPQGTPLNYVVADGCLYFHCAIEGTKLQNITANPRVGFTVVGNTEVLPDKFATNYESVMVAGLATVVGDTEKITALEELLHKYSPDFIESGRAYIERAKSSTVVVRIDIESITGKRRSG